MIKKILRWIILVLVMIVLVVSIDKMIESNKIENGNSNKTVVYVEEKSNNKDDALTVVDKYIRNDSTNRYDMYYILLREGFSDETMLYAINNTEEDWKEECLDYTKSILDKDQVSESGLIEQLTGKLYTREEIQYAMDNIEVDWNDEAVEFVEFCIGGGHSENSFRYQMFVAGFTKEEIDYAMNNVEIDYIEECYIRISYFMDINDCDEESARAELDSEGFLFEHINQAFNRRYAEERNR